MATHSNTPKLIEFKGFHAHKLDPQGRVSIPKAWRELLPQQCDLVLVCGEDENLLVYPKEDFDAKFGAYLPSANNPFDTQLTSAISAIYSSIGETNCDKNGRLSISQEHLTHLRLQAGLESLQAMFNETGETVYMMGGRGFFQIMSPAAKRRCLNLKPAYQLIRERQEAEKAPAAKPTVEAKSASESLALAKA